MWKNILWGRFSIRLRLEILIPCKTLFLITIFHNFLFHEVSKAIWEWIYQFQQYGHTRIYFVSIASSPKLIQIKRGMLGPRSAGPSLNAILPPLIHWNDTWKSPRTHLIPLQIFIKDSYAYCILHLDAIKVMVLSMNWMSTFISTYGMIKCSGWCTLQGTSVFFIFTTNYWDHLQSLKVVVLIK